MENLKELAKELFNTGEINESTIVRISELLGTYLKNNNRYNLVTVLDSTKNFVTDIYRLEPACMYHIERATCLKLKSILIDNKTLSNKTGLMILSLIKNSQVPNYDLVPKIKLDKTMNVQKIVSVLCSNQDEIQNLLLLTQILYQFNYNLEKFVNCIVLLELFKWLEGNEPKSITWYIGYWENTNKPFKVFLKDIIDF